MADLGWWKARAMSLRSSSAMSIVAAVPTQIAQSRRRKATVPNRA